MQHPSPTNPPSVSPSQWPRRAGSKALHLLVFGLMAGLWVVAVPAASGDDGIEGKLQNVERLIETSTGAARVESTSVAAALDKRAEARRLLSDARTAQAAGETTRARSLLDEAARAMFEAVRLTGSPASSGDKSTLDFDNRVDSVEALSEALSRIGSEKGASSTRALVAELTAMVSRARALRSAGDARQARTLVDQAYDKAKRGIENLRGGETLVRTLHFDSKKEEYDYEIDRNDTHRMLVDVLAREGRSSSKAMAQKFLDKARSLRQRAEGEAARDQHELAVKTLELSTKELIRAIRSTGVYIPG